MKISIRSFNQILDDIIWILTLLYLILVCVLSSETWGSIVMFGCAGGVFILSAIKTRGFIKFKFSGYHIWWLAFAIYELISSLWAISPSNAIEQANTTFKLLVCMSLFYIYYQDENDHWSTYNLIRWSGVCVSLYTIFNVGINSLMIIILNQNRLQVDFSNINVVGILAAFAIVITLYETLFRKVNIVNLFMTIPCIIVIAASGTRKALLIVLIGVCILLYYRFKAKNALKTALRLLIIGTVAAIVLSTVLSLPIFSGLMGRISSMINLFTGDGKVDGSTLLRNQMIQVGIEKFLDVPLSGIGIGSSHQYLYQVAGMKTYLHNNYVELLCCGGIWGFAIYYSMFAYCLWKLFKHRNDSDNLVKLGFTMIIIYLAMDMARVSYYSKPTFFYTMVFFLQAQLLTMSKNKRGIYENNELNK